MTRGRKPTMGISAAFFRTPVLITLRELSKMDPNVYVSSTDLENEICKQLGIDILWKGRQPTTNRPFVRVWIGAAVSKLRADNLCQSSGLSIALTPAGLTEATALATAIISDPSLKPSVSNVDGNDATQPSVEQNPTDKGSANISAATASPDLEKERKEAERKEAERNAKEKRKHKIKTGVAVEFGGVVIDVNPNVPPEACLPMPESYQVPRVGPTAKQIMEASIALKNRRSVYVWGLPGSGKDAFIHAFSALTRTPAQIFTVSPNEDIQSWFYIRSFEKDGTSWEEGEFLKAVRDGYTTPTGEKVPYTILISDLDRATKNQAEALRLVMDTIQGRVMGPSGTKYKVFPGTQIVATANSSGSGDSRGRCVSSNVLDASILDRFERKFKFDTLDWSDEQAILMKKFPKLAERFNTSLWTQLGDAVRTLRKNVEDETIFAEFGHRSICSWFGHMQDIMMENEFADVYTPKELGNILRRGLTVILDAMPDEQTRLSVQKIMDPYIKGGVVGMDVT